MIRTRINLELSKHCGTERPFGKHTFDGLLHYAGRKASLQLGKGGTFQPAGKPAMSIVNLGFRFVAGDTHFLRIDHDDVVACVDVRGKNSFVLTA